MLANLVSLAAVTLMLGGVLLMVGNYDQATRRAWNSAKEAYYSGLMYLVAGLILFCLN